VRFSTAVSHNWRTEHTANHRDVCQQGSIKDMGRPVSIGLSDDPAVGPSQGVCQILVLYIASSFPNNPAT
jgi:hypothetical protein